MDYIWRYRFGPLQEREQKRQYANANGTLNNGLLWTYTLLGADAKQLMTYNGLQADWCGQPAGTVWIWPVEHNSYGPAQSRIIMRPDGTRNIVITDHLGSTRLTLSTDAAPMQSQLHNAFGEVTSDVGEGARTGYIGREHDVESDLGFYGVRLYEPEYGRFMSTDPLWGMYITMQPYQYAGNYPVLIADPSGSEWDLSGLSEREKVRFEAALKVLGETSAAPILDDLGSMPEKIAVSFKNVELIGGGYQAEIDPEIGFFEDIGDVVYDAAIGQKIPFVQAIFQGGKMSLPSRAPLEAFCELLAHEGKHLHEAASSAGKWAARKRYEQENDMDCDHYNANCTTEKGPYELQMKVGEEIKANASKGERDE